MNPILLHLLSGGSAAGSLRYAMTKFGVPGQVLHNADDLSHGPLHDAAARLGYLEDCYRAYGDWAEPPDRKCFAKKLRAQLRSLFYDEVCIWAGGNVSEGLFLALACNQLEDFRGVITQVGACGLELLPYIGPQTPLALATLFETRQVLDAAARARLTNEYDRIRDERGQLRRWEDGRVITVPADWYDGVIIECCPSRWTRAAKIVGAVLGGSDLHNLLSDVFVAHRLKHLIDMGRIEGKGNRADLRQYSVRSVACCET